MAAWGKKNRKERQEASPEVEAAEEQQCSAVEEPSPVEGENFDGETSHVAAMDAEKSEADGEEAVSDDDDDSDEVVEDEEQIDPESVKQMREIDQEKLIAKQKGWHRLGRFFLEVTKPLSDDVKLQVGKAQSEAMMEIARIELEKKAAMSDFKSRIEVLQSAAIEGAKKILHGEHVENGHYPAFYDPETKERVYWDMDKCEEIRRIEARPEDYQMKLEPVKPQADGETPAESPAQENPDNETPPNPDEVPAENEIKKDEWRQDDSIGPGAQPAEEEARAS